MFICLLAAAAMAAAPTPIAVTSAPRVTKIATARVVILQTEKIAPVNRNAKNKGFDRRVKQRGTLTLIEFY